MAEWSHFRIGHRVLGVIHWGGQNVPRGICMVPNMLKYRNSRNTGLCSNTGAFIVYAVGHYLLILQVMEPYFCFI